MGAWWSAGGSGRRQAGQRAKAEQREAQAAGLSPLPVRAPLQPPFRRSPSRARLPGAAALRRRAAFRPLHPKVPAAEAVTLRVVPPGTAPRRAIPLAASGESRWKRWDPRVSRAAARRDRIAGPPSRGQERPLGRLARAPGRAPSGGPPSLRACSYILDEPGATSSPQEFRQPQCSPAARVSRRLRPLLDAYRRSKAKGCSAGI